MINAWYQKSSSPRKIFENRYNIQLKNGKQSLQIIPQSVYKKYIIGSRIDDCQLNILGKGKLI